MVLTPYEKIKQKLKCKIPSVTLDFIPNKWEKIGDVVTIKLDEKTQPYQKEIGKAFSNVLNCKTTLLDTGGITGDLREPNIKIIYGSPECETVHNENGIKYKLNPCKLMFSSGNIDERKRMGEITKKDEIVVDLFAGIGYFTLPIAVHGKAKKIFACEKNPLAYNYLCQNIVLNNVSGKVEPIKGDNRQVAPTNVADRVLLGFFKETKKFLKTAVQCLKNNEGIIHYHDVFPDKSVPEEALHHINAVVNEYNKESELLKFRRVKSYAPGIGHYVFDIRIK